MMPGTLRIVYTNATNQYTTSTTKFVLASVSSDGTIYMQTSPDLGPEPIILNRAAERRYQRTGKVDYKPRRPEPWQRQPLNRLNRR